MTPEELQVEKARHNCLRLITTLLLVAIFWTVIVTFGSPINLILSFIFLIVGMVDVGYWLADLINGAGPDSTQEKSESKET